MPTDRGKLANEIFFALQRYNDAVAHGILYLNGLSQSGPTLPGPDAQTFLSNTTTAILALGCDVGKRTPVLAAAEELDAKHDTVRLALDQGNEIDDMLERFAPFQLVPRGLRSLRGLPVGLGASSRGSGSARIQPDRGSFLARRHRQLLVEETSHAAFGLFTATAAELDLARQHAIPAIPALSGALYGAVQLCALDAAFDGLPLEGKEHALSTSERGIWRKVWAAGESLKPRWNKLYLLKVRS